ncbi:uncharacterized protein LOC144928074 isoform X1 [Branchiostoma floridae x Branchiostoma belcheri]
MANVHAATLGQDGAHDGQRAPSLPFLIRGSRPLMDLTRQPPIWPGMYFPGHFLFFSCIREQTVHVKPPPDTPSSPETTNVCIPGPETSIPGPGRAVRPVTPPETDVTAVPGTADATKPM